VNALLRFLFPPSDPDWTWRRRMAFGGCGVFLGGVVHGVWFEPDLARATMVITQCSLGFGGTLGAYLGIATWDDKNRRNTAMEANKP
jgi:hypothetical protein